MNLKKVKNFPGCFMGRFELIGWRMSRAI